MSETEELQAHIDALMAQLATSRKLHASAVCAAMAGARKRNTFIEQPWYKRVWCALTLKGL